ncbi:MAG: PAS domain S-box protein, partial [candidate division NC10 bacterium]
YYEIIHRLRHKDGAWRWILTRGDIVKDAQGKPLRWIGTNIDISERKRAEEGLRESEAKYRQLVESLNEGIWMIDEKAVTTFVNPRMVEMLGYTVEEMLGRHLFSFMDEQGVQIAKLNLARRQQGIKEQHDFEFLRKDGTRIYASLETAPITDLDGNYRGAIAGIVDITERKRAEEGLRESEAKLSNALQMAHAGHWEYDVDRDMFTFNDNFYRIFRTTAAAVGGYQMSSEDYARRFCYPDDVVVVGNETRAAIESTDPNYSRRIEHRILYADGQVGYITVRFFIIKDPQGRTIKTYGVNQDITESKRAEEALREERQRLAGIIKGTNAGTWEWNVQTGETIFNDRWAEIIGYTLDEISPVSIETWMKFAHPDDLRISDELLEKHFRGELDYYEFESRLKHKDGNWIWVLDRGKVTSWTEEGKPLMMMGTHQDITERKRLEQEMTKARADFLFAVSHELKTPLFLMASAQELLESLPADQRAGRFLEYGEIWNRNLHRLRHLIENLVDSQRT